MKISDLERLSRQADEQSAALARVDTKTLSFAAEAARAFQRVHTSKLVNIAAVPGAAKISRSIVAPQIAEAMKGMTLPAPTVAEAMKGMTLPAPTFAEVVRGVRIKTPSSFFFEKTLEDLSANQARVADVVGALGLPKTFKADVATALKGQPLISAADIVPRFEATATEAVVLAGTDEIAQAVDDSVSDVDNLTTSERQDLALDVLAVIGTLLALELCLLDRAYVRSAGAALFYVAGSFAFIGT